MSKLNLRHHAKRFAADESGATAIEYAMIASGVAAFIVAAVASLGGGVKAMFVKIANAY